MVRKRACHTAPQFCTITQQKPLTADPHLGRSPASLQHRRVPWRVKMAFAGGDDGGGEQPEEDEGESEEDYESDGDYLDSDDDVFTEFDSEEDEFEYENWEDSSRKIEFSTVYYHENL